MLGQCIFQNNYCPCGKLWESRTSRMSQSYYKLLESGPVWSKVGQRGILGELNQFYSIVKGENLGDSKGTWWKGMACAYGKGNPHSSAQAMSWPSWRGVTVRGIWESREYWEALGTQIRQAHIKVWHAVNAKSFWLSGLVGALIGCFKELCPALAGDTLQTAFLATFSTAQRSHSHLGNGGLFLGSNKLRHIVSTCYKQPWGYKSQKSWALTGK